MNDENNMKETMPIVQRTSEKCNWNSKTIALVGSEMFTNMTEM